MTVLNYILLILVFCLTPALVLKLCRKFPVLDAIGPVVILYILGVIMGNLGFIGIKLCPAELPVVQEILNSAMVPLAIPMMLFGCVFRKSDIRSHVKALISGLAAVIIAVVAGFFIFRSIVTSPGDPDFAARISAMLSGVYTGGTVNMASIQKMLGVSEETFVLANTADMIISFLYLIFLMTIGIRLFRRILPFNARELDETGREIIGKEVDRSRENPYAGLFTRAGLKSGLASVGTAVAIFLVSFLVATGIDSIVKADVFMMVLILMLTTLGIGASFVKPIRELKYSYWIGMYFIYIFSFVVASMADLSQIDLARSIGIFGLIGFIVFGSLLLHIVFSRFLKIDADTVTITSVAYINSPPLVPMIAAAMKNKDVLVPGLTVGIVGYAVGNYLGLFIFQLLSAL